jgi:hypothetical protein
MMTLLDELIDAYLDSDIDHRCAVDMVQGIIVLDWDEAVTGEPGIDWEDPESEERYCAIPQCRNDEAYECRQRFAAQDSSGRVSDALNHSRPFRHFKDALSELALWDDWNAFERAWAQSELEPWMQTLPVPYSVLADRYREYWKAQGRVGF